MLSIFRIIHLVLILVSASTFAGNIDYDQFSRIDFNNGTYPDSPDLSGNNHSIYVAYCDYTYDRFGNSESALKFDGLNSFAIADFDQGYWGHPWGREFSISIWFTRLGNFNVNSHLAGYPRTWPGGWQIMLGNENNGQQLKVRVDTANNNDTSWDINVGNAFPLATWNHLVVSYESGSGIKAYVNDQLIATNSRVSGDIIKPEYFFTLGRGYEDGVVTKDIIGTMDDLRIYNRAITSSEVGELFRYGRPPELD